MATDCSEHNLWPHGTILLLSLVTGSIGFSLAEQPRGNTQSLSFLLWQRPGPGATQGTESTHRCSVTGQWCPAQPRAKVNLTSALGEASQQMVCEPQKEKEAHREQSQTAFISFS